MAIAGWRIKKSNMNTETIANIKLELLKIISNFKEVDTSKKFIEVYQKLEKVVLYN